MGRFGSFRFGAALVMAALLAVPAAAHGPSRQKISEKVEINAAPDKVWAVIGNFQDMSWHPAIEKTAGTGGSDVGASRTLTLKGGATIEEKLNKYNKDGRSYGYEISKVDVKVLPVHDYSSTIVVEDAGGKSVVEWKGAFYRGYMNNDPPPELSDEAAKKAVTGVYRAGLDALKAKIEGGK